ncbi:MAG: DUF5667 domain-containing protein, partial [Actinomycetota bacterium]
MKRRVDDELLDQALQEPTAAQAELEGLLRMSRALSEAFEAEPTEHAVAGGRNRALAAFEVAGQVAVIGRGRSPRLVTPYPWLPQVRLRMLATAAIVIGILGTLIAGGHGALPGDSLYGMKLGVEQVRLAAAIDPFDKAGVHLDIADARIREVLHAKEAGRTDAMRESLRRYTDAIVAVELELRSGDLSDAQASQVLGDAADTLALQQEVLEQIQPETPAAAEPELKAALDTLESIDLPPPPDEEPADEPTPGPSVTPTEPSPSPTPSETSTEQPSPTVSETPTEDPSPVASEPPPEDQEPADGGRLVHRGRGFGP